ncbi:hypothetical protein GOC40_24690 [Sinorhizobium meliloti]|uniref:hypothetical protein n=1 Tax=Rhizobium meliloti TaxID=382 RepID=UPI00299F4F6D|nr:hypothetical protein [Sinorhizobium meliloti]MDX0221144.1 hypothetical protein [Sinorhizobium meliloti]MDX0227321.1 hypothetical protein [Sinorhizobium meliloti]
MGKPVAAVRRNSESWPIRRLVAQLRAMDVSVGPKEAEQVFFVAASSSHWERDRLRRVVSGLLARNDMDRVRFDAAFDSVFPPALSHVDPFADSAALSIATGGQTGLWPMKDTATASDGDLDPLPPPVDPSPKSAVGKLAVVVAEVATKLLTDRLGMAIAALGVCGLIALGLRSGTEFEPPVDTPSVVPLTAWAFAGFAAAALFAPALLAVRWMTRSEPVITRWRSPPPPAGVVAFRIGLVGGPPPLAIDAERGKVIGDLFAYSAGSEDTRLLDVDRTIDAVVNAGGYPTIRHPAERILPVIVVLVDTTSPARVWNSLPEELTETLLRRGLDVRLRRFQGSLHAGSADAPAPTKAGSEILAMAEDEHNLATLCFSDGARWRDADTQILQRLAAQGPVFWFDDRDRELWDYSLEGLRHAHIKIWEATAAAVEEALRAAYAPGHGIGTPAAGARAALRRRRTFLTGGETAGPRVSEILLQDEVFSLLGSALGWAAHCAILEPMSYGLADAIRQRFHPDLPWIAFSRLAALPGTSVGVEGIRYQGAVRSLLLANMAQQEPTATREAVVELIAAKLAHARHGLPPDSPAQALADLAIARVSLHSKPDEAVRDLVRIRDEGMVEPGPVDDFLNRIRLVSSMDAIGAAGVIPVAAPPRNADTLRMLDNASPNAAAAGTVPRWEISAPELRIDIGGTGAGDGVLAAFFMEDRLLLSVPAGQEGVELRLISVTSGLEDASPTRVPSSATLLAGRDQVAALSSAKGDSFSIFRDDDLTEGRPRLLAVPADIGFPVTRVDAAPRRDAAIALAGGTIQVFGRKGAERPPTPSQRTITAMSEIDAERILVGTSDGRMAILLLEAELALGDVALPGAVSAVSITPSTHTAGRKWLTVAVAYSVSGMAEGRAWYAAVFDFDPDMGAVRQQDAVVKAMQPRDAPFRPRTIPLHMATAPASLELSTDGKTVLVVGERSIDLFDVSTGLSTLSGDASDLLGSLGFGQNRSIRILAADLSARRLALLTDDPPRLEVRRLERIVEATPGDEGLDDLETSDSLTVEAPNA